LCTSPHGLTGQKATLTLEGNSNMFRPTRIQQRPDRLFNHEEIGSETAEGIYHAMRAVDKTATDMETRWGVDRLPSLVEPALAARFGKAKAQLDAAIDENDVAAVTRKASAMQRGWAALDGAARAAGAESIAKDAEVWHWRHPESRQGYVIVKDQAAARHVLVKDSRVYTLDEVCRIIAAFDSTGPVTVAAIKEAWPGAEVTTVKNRGPDPDDELPF